MDQINLMSKNSFAYLNISYINDIRHSKALYNSFKKFYSGSSPFFIACPESDYSEFIKHFSREVLIKKEDIILQTSIPIAEYREIAGYEDQQIIKLTFFELFKNLNNYVTIDSDIIFIKSFSDDSFFENNTIKTSFCNKKESKWGSKINDIYSRYGNVLISNDFKNFYFMNGIGFWNVKILQHLKQFVFQTELKNFIEMIKLAPVEMEWYGKFLYLFHKEDFVPMHNICGLISGYISNRLYLNYKSEELIYAEYLLRKNDNIATILQYCSGCRPHNTLEDIIFRFRGKKLNKPLYSFIKFIAFFGIPKYNGTKIKSSLCSYFSKYLFI